MVVVMSCQFLFSAFYDIAFILYILRCKDGHGGDLTKIQS